MIANKEINNKKCCFYASDFHLEMTLVPYINKKIEENKEVIIVTQKQLEESVKVLLSKMNIKNKQKILEIDWNNSNINKIIGKENSTIIINGTKQFIEKQNQEVTNILGKQFCELINCFYFDEIKDEIVEIRENYTSALNNLQKSY